MMLSFCHELAALPCRMSLLDDTISKLSFRLYLWAAQLLPDILVKTNETGFTVSPTRDKPSNEANQVSRSSFRADLACTKQKEKPTYLP
jgi:hypothetical protein